MKIDNFLNHTLIHLEKLNRKIASKYGNLAYPLVGDPSEPQSGDRILRLSEVIFLTGVSESTIRRLEERDLFPPRRQLTKRAVGWLKSEVLTWIARRGLTDEKYPPWYRDDK